MPTTRAVLFDFAGTLWSDRALRETHLGTLQQVATRAGVDAPPPALRDAYRRGLGQAGARHMQAPYYTHRDLFRDGFAHFVEALGGDATPGVADWGVDEQYRVTLRDARLRPDCRETLQALRDAGLHVGLVSNIDDEQLHPLLDAFALGDCLDAVTSSEEARSCKPDAGIFRHALGKAGCRADEAVFVGDTVMADVMGALAMGMTSVLIVEAGRRLPVLDESETPHHVVRDLAAVLPIARGTAR